MRRWLWYLLFVPSFRQWAKEKWDSEGPYYPGEYLDGEEIHEALDR
jgi:hypothetical protein